MKQQILIWDIPTRVCHWLLAVGVVYAWFSVEILEDMEQHFWAGYTVLTLLLFRLTWGFVGSDYARFSRFFFRVGEIVDYAKTLPKKRSQPSMPKRHYLGHNPLGSLAALGMLTVLSLQAVTGLFSNDDYFFGPLSGLVGKGLSATITEIHHLNFNVVEVLVGLHILAIIFYRLYKKEKLVAAMITGKKSATSLDDKGIADSKLLLALFIMVLCIAVVYGLANAFTDSLPSVDYYY
ncbi:cytochrome B [Exilibacterium tricleocarpae]|uniref:Cytochrome B n=1 Tax=Exilibacterium tricleocarpae TaxID=2591008 RepID=A0A545TQB6_9GAMM|nr:cytochrome b/b6 domain-containing protein [Exilibacterium tricleocarpae]TQV79414.1 cytochrome B [Exilibacterium tricleocarpae]